LVGEARTNNHHLDSSETQTGFSSRTGITLIQSDYRREFHRALPPPHKLSSLQMIHTTLTGITIGLPRKLGPSSTHFHILLLLRTLLRRIDYRSSSLKDQKSQAFHSCLICSFEVLRASHLPSSTKHTNCSFRGIYATLSLPLLYNGLHGCFSRRRGPRHPCPNLKHYSNC